MRILFKNLSQKFGFFLVIYAVLFELIAFFLHWRGIDSVPIFWMGSMLVAIFSGIFFGFLFLVSYPLDCITEEIKRLLGGKKYRRLRPHGVDEVAMITHFFNEITRNLEAISTDFNIQRKILTELSAASQVQRDILPKVAPSLPGLDVAVRTQSINEVSGDAFDFIPAPNGTFLYIGDVSGHGVPAGMVMTMAHVLLHVFSRAGDNSFNILSKTNDILHEHISTERFMTMALLRWHFEERKMFFTGAGHEHILVYRAATNAVEIIRTGGVALRVVRDMTGLIEEKPLPFEENDVLLLYTDGIVEARAESGEMYGVERLAEVLRTNASYRSSQEILENIVEDISLFLETAEQSDDMTMIVLRRQETKEK